MSGATADQAAPAAISNVARSYVRFVFIRKNHVVHILSARTASKIEVTFSFCTVPRSTRGSTRSLSKREGPSAPSTFRIGEEERRRAGLGGCGSS